MKTVFSGSVCRLVVPGIALIIMMSACANAKIIKASSGSNANLQTAFNSAVTGDTVQIPSGNFTFSGSTTCNAGITIMGAGAANTILTKTGTFTGPFITVNGANGKRCIITGIGMVGDQTAGSSLLDYGITLTNGCIDFRIYKCSIKKFGWAGIRVNGNSRGVIDQCSIIDNYRPPVGNIGYGVAVFGDMDASWNRPLNLGSADAVFVEDCYFSGNRHHITSNGGSRYVFRHNRCTNPGGGFQSIDAHGAENSARGSRSYEIYYDTIDNASTSGIGIYIRGGDGVIFNNTVVRGVNIPIQLTNKADGTGPSAYPGLDQIRSLYIWGNTNQGKPVLAYVRSGYEGMIQLNRDYFNTQKPGYVPYSYPHPLRNITPTAAQAKATISTKAAGLTIQGERVVVSIETISDFRISVCDIQGREVMTRNVENTGAGSHSFALPKASGIYVVTLIWNDAKIQRLAFTRL